jgi:predicted nucleic acid-binding protein
VSRLEVTHETILWRTFQRICGRVSACQVLAYHNDIVSLSISCGGSVLSRYEKDTTLQTTGITALELYKGAMISGTESNRLKVAAILELFTVIPVDESIYEAFGRLSAVLSLNGNPFGDFDEVVAAIAIRFDGEIITRDRHFSKVPRLKVISY